MLDTTLLTADKEPAVSYPAPSPTAATELNIAFDQHAHATGELTIYRHDAQPYTLTIDE